MSTTITVRNMDPRDKSWLKREAHRRGVSMEELVRHLIHEGRENTECRVKPSEARSSCISDRNTGSNCRPGPLWLSAS